MSTATGRTRTAALVIMVATFVLAACTHELPRPIHARPLPTPPPISTTSSQSHPNIVFVLTDDLSWNLVKYMPHVVALEHSGMTFTNYTVADSLCCPSRASIFTGQYPHNTHVIANTPPHGGFAKFQARHEDRSTFATSLLRSAYRTAFMGKYLNGYQPESSSPLEASSGAYVPPGWTNWFGVGSGGYSQYNYIAADGHRLAHYGNHPDDYLNTVLTQKATQFIRGASGTPNPFMLEIASYTPHQPYVPAPRDLGRFPGVRAPQTPAFNTLPYPTPTWMQARRTLDAAQIRKITTMFRLRVEAVQSIDRMIASIERTLKQVGRAKNTVIVFTSDNGYHLGDYTLESGKQTAFDTDIRVPLIVAGPGIAPESFSTAMVQNVDLRPTFEQLAGASTPAAVDGHSFAPLLHGQAIPWRTYALIEHHKTGSTANDPDVQSPLDGVPPSYAALRTRSFVYVRYLNGEHDYFNLIRDPYELHNLGPGLSASRLASLDQILSRLGTCHGGVACWRAGGLAG